MRIDNDCIRDILFVIEENSTSEQACYMDEFETSYPRLANYNNDKLKYHIRYLLMKGLIFRPDERTVNLYDLLPDGHEFLANIRNDNNWNKILSVSSSIGFASLKVISAIAEGVATAAINTQLGFTK